ncbi:MAG: ABC transporter substrate-binding protein [Flavisolibacter sp.]
MFTDQTGRRMELKAVPKKIISLVPSQTELLFDLGLEDEVIGITKFCVHPQKWFHTKTRIGGTKKLDLEKIRSLQPDLIIANREENEKKQVEELEKYFPVWISDITNLQQASDMILSLGLITGKEEKAKEIADEIKLKFSKLQPSRNERRLKTAYLIWREPYMTVGADTFIHDMLGRVGLENIFSNSLRYPQTTIEQLKMLDCQLLLLSSEPYPFTHKHKEEIEPDLPNTKILLVDGEMFSWYGSRLLKAPNYFQELQKQFPTRP